MDEGGTVSASSAGFPASPVPLHVSLDRLRDGVLRGEANTMKLLAGRAVLKKEEWGVGGPAAGKVLGLQCSSRTVPTRRVGSLRA